MKIYPSGSVAYDQLSPFGVVVQRWTPIDVRNWLFGFGDFIVEYLPNFRDIDGDSLLTLFNGDLKDLGVENSNVRRKICSILKQLTHLCYDAEDENLQILIAAVGTRAKNLYNELKKHLNSKTKNQRALPSNFVALCSRLDEKVKKLLSWFDRPPFSGEQRFDDLKKSISTITLDILDWNLNDNTLTREQCRQLVTSLQISCAQLFTLCDKILQENSDVLLIQNAYFERCDLNRRSADIDLGIFIDTIDNRHIVKSLKFQSPADLARKIDVGDEILDVNGQIVVGWTRENVQNRLFRLKSLKITFLLKKQPRDSWNVFKLTTSHRHRKSTADVVVRPPHATSNLSKIVENSPRIEEKRDENDDYAAVVVAADADRSSSSKSSTTSTLETVVGARRRRSSSFSHVFRPELDENSTSQNEEFSVFKRTRKWKSVKAPTVPLTAVVRSANFPKTTTTLRPRTRRITVSGGSPTLKRLSLHVHDRKCSLMPRDGREDESDVAILESPQIKQKLTQLFSDAQNQSTSSSTEGPVVGPPPNLPRSPGDDDVFVNAQTNPDRPDRVFPFQNGSPKDSAGEEILSGQKSKIAGNLGEQTITDFALVTAGPLMAADDVLWSRRRKIGDEPKKSEIQTFDLKGVVDFDGATILPNLVNEISRKKIERFFGENFDESMERITSSDNVSNFSTTDDESSSPPIKIRSSPTKSPCSQKSLRFLAGKFLHGGKDQKDPSSGNNKNILLLEDSISSTGSQLSLLSKSPHRFLRRYWKMSNLSLNNNINGKDSKKYEENSEMTAYSTLNNAKLSALIFDQSESMSSLDQHSGWLFRYKFADEFSTPSGHAPVRQSRWSIRWAVLRDDILQLYVRREDSRPEGLICLNGCKVRPCPSARLKSSKKNIFQIVYENAPFYFYCPERKDMIEWLNKLGLSAIGYSKPKTDSNFEGFYFERFVNQTQD